MGEAEYFQEQARQCRRDAEAASCPEDRRGLIQMATYYDREALRAARDLIRAATSRADY